MLMDIQVHPRYEEIAIAGNVPDALRGRHQNSRGISFAGCINHAVDLLVAHRFEVDLDAIFLQILGINHAVHLDRFLSAGGFDEALLKPEESIIEFRLRLLEVEDEAQEYEALLNDLLEMKTSDQLESKLMLRRGKAPSLHETSVPLQRDSPAQGSLEPEQMPMTLCVTFGDIELASQFLKSLDAYCPEGFDVHLVACCFGVAANRIMEVVEEVDCLFTSVKILPESWGHDEGASGRLGPWYLDAQNRHGVSWGRCVLHRAAAIYSPSEAMWILDDDIEFDAHSLRACQRAFDSMKKQGLQVGIGAITGDAPIPAAYMIRTQVIDFFYRSFLGSEAARLVPQLGQPFHDMHHDLSTSRTDHLEFPLGAMLHAVSPHFNHPSSMGIPSRVQHIEGTDNSIFAPEEATLNEPLLQITNMAPKIGGISRRGDMPRGLNRRAGHRKREFGDGPTNQCFTLGILNSLRGDIVKQVSRVIGCETPSVEVFLNDVIIREARLICNLKRVTALLGLMDYNGREKRAVAELMSELIAHRPETSRDALEYFSTYRNKEVAFCTAGSVN